MFRGSSRDLEIVLGIAVLGGTMMITGFRRFVLCRRVEDLARSSVGTAPQGLVEVSGRALPLQSAQVVDCMGNACVFLDYEIGFGSGRRRFRVRKGREGTRFILEDESGSVHVFTAGADLQMREQRFDWEVVPEEHRNRLLPQSPEGFLAKLFVNTVPSPQGMWIVERKILLGAEAYVLGALRSRAREPEVKVQDAKGFGRTVNPVGGIMRHPVHPLVIADGAEHEVLRRLMGGVPMMILGAGLLTLSAGIARLFWF